jgi:hypothetical protein
MRDSKDSKKRQSGSTTPTNDGSDKNVKSDSTTPANGGSDKKQKLGNGVKQLADSSAGITSNRNEQKTSSGAQVTTQQAHTGGVGGIDTGGTDTVSI